MRRSFGRGPVTGIPLVLASLISSTFLITGSYSYALSVDSAAAPHPGTLPLTVTKPEPGSASANPAPLVVGAGAVTLSLQPNEGTQVRVSKFLYFGVNVTGTTNTAVQVEVNGIPGGNATVGFALASNGNITYHAPAVRLTTNNYVTLSVYSVYNPKIALSRYIEILNPIPILATATPMAFKTGPATLVLGGQYFVSGAQVLVNGFPVPTTFNSSAKLTATLNLSEPGDLDLQVLNPSPGPAASADLVVQVEGTPPAPIVAPNDAARFLEQATFGATDTDIHNLSSIGYEAWLNEQFARPATPIEPEVEQAIILNNQPCSPTSLLCNAALFVQNNESEIYVQNAFWQQSLTANDQLRQRVKYALSQIFVISGTNPAVQNMPRGEANYYDLLGADAFGNFRKLLEDVTLNPMMGQFLSMLGNDKGNATTNPDENYAREIMQLFTIGLYQLNPDGTQKLVNGQPIPTYSNNDVMGLAKVFTGWSWNVPNNDTEAVWSNCCAWVGQGHGEDLLPMQSFASHHSTEEKQFLGGTIPVQSTPNPKGDLNIALDLLFAQPNMPPFFCRQLIQHLVTSNPSPAYVGRVSAIFKDNGKGVRGDMQAVITAILLDPEARDLVYNSNPEYGKVRESLLRYTEWARAFSAQSKTGSYWLGSTEDPIWGLGEMPLRSPTVFNWFTPGYVPPGTSIEKAGLVAPEMQMTNVSTVVGYVNFMQDAIGSNATNGADVYSTYAAETRIAINPELLADRINLLLMAGQMSTTLRNRIVDAINSIYVPASPQSVIDSQLMNRVQTAIYLTMASPEFSAQF